MKIEGDYQIVEVGRCSSGRSDVVLGVVYGVNAGPTADQLTLTGINQEQAKEVAKLFGERVRVTIEISKVAP
jgi:hypothetical protein